MMSTQKIDVDAADSPKIGVETFRRRVAFGIIRRGAPLDCALRYTLTECHVFCRIANALRKLVRTASIFRNWPVVLSKNVILAEPMGQREMWRSPKPSIRSATKAAINRCAPRADRPFKAKAGNDAK
jgi:hypothetical protein